MIDPIIQKQLNLGGGKVIKKQQSVQTNTTLIDCAGDVWNPDFVQRMTQKIDGAQLAVCSSSLFNLLVVRYNIFVQKDPQSSRTTNGDWATYMYGGLLWHTVQGLPDTVFILSNSDVAVVCHNFTPEDPNWAFEVDNHQ